MLLLTDIICGDWGYKITPDFTKIDAFTFLAVVGLFIITYVKVKKNKCNKILESTVNNNPVNLDILLQPKRIYF